MKTKFVYSFSSLDLFPTFVATRFEVIRSILRAKNGIENYTEKARNQHTDLSSVKILWAIN